MKILLVSNGVIEWCIHGNEIDGIDMNGIDLDTLSRKISLQTFGGGKFLGQTHFISVTVECIVLCI